MQKNGKSGCRSVPAGANTATPATDASRNIVPWGVLIGGEELHNNHHAFATSAKLSNKWFEFDIGWLYIRILEMLGLARVKKVRMDIGHVAVFRAIVHAAATGPELEAELFEALQRKDLPALRGLTRRLDAKTRAALLLLPELYGGAEVLALAETKLPAIAALKGALVTLRAAVEESYDARLDVYPLGATDGALTAGDAIVVRKVGRWTSKDIHDRLFPDGPPAAPDLAALKEGIERHVRTKHGRR